MLLWTPGIGELAIIFFIVLLIFGGKKLPSLARSIGSGINEFKKGMSGQEPFDADETLDEKNSKTSEPKKKSSKQ